MSYATLTITPATTADGGTFTVAGQTVGPADSLPSSITGGDSKTWSLTSGTTYNAGAFTYTCDVEGSAAQPTFDDSPLGTNNDATITVDDFDDGTDEVSGSAAVLIVNVGSGDYAPDGTWSFEDWSGPVGDTPSSTNWQADQSLAAARGGQITFTRKSNGSGVSAPSWDTSGVTMSDGLSSSPWNGSVTQSSLADGTDEESATAASFNLNYHDGSAVPTLGSFSLNSTVNDLSSALACDGWNNGGGATFTNLRSGSVGFGCTSNGSGQSAPSVTLALLDALTGYATPSFTNGAGGAGGVELPAAAVGVSGLLECSAVMNLF